MKTKNLRIVVILLMITTFFHFCKKDDKQIVTFPVREKLDPKDDPLIALAYDSTYFYPNDFYVDFKQEGSFHFSLYYLNTFYLKPNDSLIELSTNDKADAFEWKEQFIVNMNNIGISSSEVGEERETEKYFEFPQIYTTDSNAMYAILFRANKSSYFKPYTYIIEIARSIINGEVAKVGYYYGALDEQNVKEFIEYYWSTHAGMGKVASVQFKDKGDYFEEHICSFALIMGDWGMKDQIKVFDIYVCVDKNSRLVTLQQLFQRYIP